MNVALLFVVKLLLSMLTMDITTTLSATDGTASSSSSSSSSSNSDVVIIGGGLSGLSAALRLTQQRNSRLNITVLEARDRLGGRCLSVGAIDLVSEKLTG